MVGTGRIEQPERRQQRLRKSAVGTSLAATILLCLSIGASASAARTDPASSLVLQESLNGLTQCVSPDATCTTPNLYAQNGAPGPSSIAPGQHHATTVELRNAGNITASNLDLLPGSCHNYTVNGGPPTSDLCGTVDLVVACTTGGTTNALGPTTLTNFGEIGTQALTRALAPGASTTCTFTETYPAHTPAPSAGTGADQPVTWLLTAGDIPPQANTPRPGEVSGQPAPGNSLGPAQVAPQSGLLPSTGTGALSITIVGSVLLATGGVMFWWSRRRAPTFRPRHQEALSSRSGRVRPRSR
jgi:LPXTG-motif cell wall-anchored protein